MEDENKSASNAEAENKPAANTEAESKAASNGEAENKSDNKRTLIIAGAVVATVAIVAAAVVMVLNNRSTDIDEGVTPLGYAENVTALDPDSLQALVDQLALEDGEFATEYRGVAMSGDGRNFTCYIGNSNLNKYDMYIQIFADGGFTDQVFLSQLLRPGTAFDSISLDHALDPGTNVVYVVFTQVEDDHATIHGQVTVTMEFVVTE